MIIIFTNIVEPEDDEEHVPHSQKAIKNRKTFGINILKLKRRSFWGNTVLFRDDLYKSKL